MKKIKEFFAPILRPIFGYKYKIVYTELDISKASFKHRYMAKLKIDEPNDKILYNLQKINGCKYTTPITIFYSKSERALNQRVRLSNKDFPILVFNAHFK